MPLNIQQVRGQFPNRDLHYFDTIDTTMREAAALAAAGAAPGTTVIAEEQTAGQGRHGHTWHSEPSVGLYLSILLSPKLAAAPTLTMALGQQQPKPSHPTAHPATPLANDILINGKKQPASSPNSPNRRHSRHRNQRQSKSLPPSWPRSHVLLLNPDTPTPANSSCWSSYPL
jgi:hypothetical protein